MHSAFMTISSIDVSEVIPLARRVNYLLVASDHLQNIDCDLWVIVIVSHWSDLIYMSSVNKKHKSGSLSVNNKLVVGTSNTLIRCSPFQWQSIEFSLHCHAAHTGWTVLYPHLRPSIHPWGIQRDLICKVSPNPSNPLLTEQGLDRNPRISYCHIPMQTT